MAMLKGGRHSSAVLGGEHGVASKVAGIEERGEKELGVAAAGECRGSRQLSSSCRQGGEEALDAVALVDSNGT